jgi:hypothetical protein
VDEEDESILDKNKPASHFVQIVAPFLEVSADVQFLHCCFPASSMYVPSVHGWQFFSASFPFSLETFPGEQSLQRFELVTPVAEEYLP